MNNERFQAHLAAWQAMPGDMEDQDYAAQRSPGLLDAKLDALCTLYLEASAAQQSTLSSLFAAGQGGTSDYLAAYEHSDALLEYIRRVARRIKTAEHDKLAQVGLAAAAMASAAGADERDILHSCAFLKYATIQAGIDLSAMIEALLLQVQPEARRVLAALRKSDEATITRIVRYHQGTG